MMQELIEKLVLLGFPEECAEEVINNISDIAGERGAVEETQDGTVWADIPVSVAVIPVSVVTPGTPVRAVIRWQTKTW